MVPKYPNEHCEHSDDYFSLHVAGLPPGELEIRCHLHKVLPSSAAVVGIVAVVVIALLVAMVAALGAVGGSGGNCG